MSDSIFSDKTPGENERQNGRGDNFSPSSLSSESNLSGATFLNDTHRGWGKTWGSYLCAGFLLHPSHHPPPLSRTPSHHFQTFRCSPTSSQFSVPSLPPFSHKPDPNPLYQSHALRHYLGQIWSWNIVSQILICGNHHYVGFFPQRLVWFTPARQRSRVNRDGIGLAPPNQRGGTGWPIFGNRTWWDQCQEKHKAREKGPKQRLHFYRGCRGPARAHIFTNQVLPSPCWSCLSLWKVWKTFQKPKKFWGSFDESLESGRKQRPNFWVLNLLKNCFK